MANTLEIVIKATDKASKEISDIGKSLSGLATVGGGIAAGIGVAAAAAVAAAGAVGVGLGKLAVDALPLQGIGDAFEGITGDADGMLKALQEGSLGMVSNRDLMMSYNQAAQLVGENFANQLPDAMQYLSKVSAATGEDMSFMMDSLVKGVGRMSPMILDNLGIQVSLEEATARAAEMFGKEADELSKAEQQAGMMDVVLGKLRTNTEKMPDVAGTAAQKWASLGTAFQNIKDNVGVALAPALETLMEPLGRLTEKVSEFTQSEEFQEWIATATEKLGEFVTRVVDEWIPAAIETFERVSNWFKENEGVIVGVLAVIGAALIAFGIQSAIAMAPVLIAMAPIIAIMAAIGVAAYLLYEAWTNNWGGIQEKTKVVTDWIKSTVSAFVGKILAWWTEHGDKIIATVKGMWDWVKAAFADAIQWVLGRVALALTTIALWWDENGEAVMGVVEALWEGIKSAFSTAFDIVKGIVNMALAMIRGDWYEAGVQLRGVVDTIWESIKTAFNLAKTALVTIVETLVSNVKDKFTDIDWGAVGRGIINGIRDGVQAAAGWLGQAAADAARAALDAAKGFLGIRSPSKVTAELIGKPFAQGIFKGIEDATKALQRTTMPDIMASLVATPLPARMGAGAAASTVNNSPQYHLHINTSAPTENIIADFAVLQALAG